MIVIAEIHAHLELTNIFIVQTFKRCLPSALKRRDFSRVITLAQIGSRTAGSLSPYEQGISSKVIGWSKQDGFLTQCETLTVRAFWWKILQQFKVSFEPSDFETENGRSKELKEKKMNKSGVSRYAGTLIDDLIYGASKAIQQPRLVLSLASDFAKKFNLDTNTAAQKHVEFLLSLPGFSSKGTDSFEHQEESSRNERKDIRHDLMACEAAVKDIIFTLLSSTSRLLVLRRCLISIEKIDESGRDFDRYSMILSLYRMALHSMINERGMIIKNTLVTMKR